MAHQLGQQHDGRIIVGPGDLGLVQQRPTLPGDPGLHWQEVQPPLGAFGQAVRLLLEELALRLVLPMQQMRPGPIERS